MFDFSIVTTWIDCFLRDTLGLGDFWSILFECVLVGVGIATSVETAAVLSRKAILRPIGSRHPNPKAAELELRLEEGLNRLGIGPQGLTGNSSVMGVHIESAARHPSTIGVAVSTGCWAHRRGTLLVHADLTFENLSHTRSAL